MIAYKYITSVCDDEETPFIDYINNEMTNEDKSMICIDGSISYSNGVDYSLKTDVVDDTINVLVEASDANEGVVIWSTDKLLEHEAIKLFNKHW